VRFRNIIAVIGGMTAVLGLASHANSQAQQEVQLREAAFLPMGRVRMVDEAGRAAVVGAVDIPAYGELYAVLGVTSSRFREWEMEYGMDSLGIGDDGVLLLPAFPVFSKIAWTYIDSVDLSPEETAELVRESQLAATRCAGDTQRLFLSICEFARAAGARSMTLRIGPP
jgi:hypothetical protein